VTTTAENVIVTPILLETNVPNALLNILHSPLVKLACAMLMDLKIILVMKMENVFVTLMSLETNANNVLLDLSNSQPATSVLPNILAKPAKNVNVIRMVLPAMIAIQLTENVLVMNTLSVTIVIPPNQDFLTSLIQNHVLAMVRALSIIIAIAMENVLAKKILLGISATNVQVDSLDSPVVKHANVMMMVLQFTTVTRMECAHANQTYLETNVIPVTPDTPISLIVMNVNMNTMASVGVDTPMKDMTMTML
jgi:hypothetical protein